MTNLAQLQALLSKPKKIVIITHPHPDGDAMGSSFALYNYLIQLKHSAWVISPTSYPEYLNWFPGIRTILVHPNHKEFIHKSIANAQIIFCLDFNHLQRIPELGDAIAQSKAKKVLIDHHQQPEDFADFSLSDILASSTAELIFRFIEMLGDEPKINKDIATCIYTGMMTDTGSFQYSCTTPQVHRIAARLLEKEIDFVAIHNRVNNSYSQDRIKLLGFCLSERIKFFPEYHAAMIWLSQEDIQKFQLKPGETEGMVNYPLKVKGINFSVFITDRINQIKLSFRSIGKFDVNQMAREHFNGGGHINASGGQSKDTLENVLQKLESLLPQYQNDLNY